MASRRSIYWDDLADDVKDPEFLRSYIVERVRVSTIDHMVNDLEEARTRLKLSKAELARAIGADSAVIRRLLTLGHRNPTIGTVTEVAAALGLRVALIPMTDEEREQVAEPLRAGAKDPEELVRTFASARASAQ